MMASLKLALERRGGSDIAVRFLLTRGNGHVVLSPLHVIGFCLRMLMAKIAGRADVVHINVSSHGSTYRKIVIAAAARFLGIPYVLHLHGSRYVEFWRGGDSFAQGRIRWMFERAAQVIVLGRVWQDFVTSRAPAAADKIVIVPNATAIPTLAQAGGGAHVHILFLGRVGDRKGVPQLIEALGRLAALDNWRATIAGDGDIDKARASVAALGVSDRVALPGWVGPDEVAGLIASADILALPSFAENLPVSVIEGMAAGLAVIATPVGAVEDIIIHGETGLLVPPGDADVLADALQRLIADTALREKLGTAAMALHREKLELQPFAEAICEVWKQAAGVGG